MRGNGYRQIFVTVGVIEGNGDIDSGENIQLINDVSLRMTVIYNKGRFAAVAAIFGMAG